MSLASQSQAILNSMSDGVVSLDRRGTITALNPAAADILGLDPAEVLGNTYAEVFFLLPGNDDFNQVLLDAAAAQEALPYSEAPYTRSDGEVRLLALTASVLRDGAQEDAGEADRLGAVLVFKDVTNIHQLRSQRDELSGQLAAKHEELKKAYLDLEEKNRSLEEAQRKTLWIKLGAGALGLLVFLAVFGWMIWGGADGGPSEEPLQAIDAGGPRSVKAVTGTVSEVVVCKGFVQPIQRVTVTSRISGRVIERLVELGQMVDKGQVLFRLDPSAVLPKVRQAEAALLRARKKVDEIETWSKRPEFRQAQRAVELLRQDLKRQRKIVKDNAELFKQGIIPYNDLENTRTELRRTEVSLANAMERLSTAKDKGSDQALRLARLELLNAEAADREARAQHAATVVEAPTAGVVIRPAGQKEGEQAAIPEVGQQVNSGQALLTLGAPQPLGVLVDVNEVQVKNLRAGQPATVSGQAFPGRLAGRVRWLSPQAVTKQRVPLFPVMVEMAAMPPAAVQAVRLGMSASVRIIVKQAKDAVLLPVVAVGTHQGRDAVRVKKDGKLVWQPVTTGISDRDNVQIVKGLAAGETVFW